MEYGEKLKDKCYENCEPENCEPISAQMSHMHRCHTTTYILAI